MKLVQFLLVLLMTTALCRAWSWTRILSKRSPDENDYDLQAGETDDDSDSEDLKESEPSLETDLLGFLQGFTSLFDPENANSSLGLDLANIPPNMTHLVPSKSFALGLGLASIFQNLTALFDPEESNSTHGMGLASIFHNLTALIDPEESNSTHGMGLASIFHNLTNLFDPEESNSTHGMALNLTNILSNLNHSVALNGNEDYPTQENPAENALKLLGQLLPKLDALRSVCDKNNNIKNLADRLVDMTETCSSRFDYVKEDILVLGNVTLSSAEDIREDITGVSRSLEQLEKTMSPWFGNTSEMLKEITKEIALTKEIAQELNNQKPSAAKVSEKQMEESTMEPLLKEFLEAKQELTKTIQGLKPQLNCVEHKSSEETSEDSVKLEQHIDKIRTALDSSQLQLSQELDRVKTATEKTSKGIGQLKTSTETMKQEMESRMLNLIHHQSQGLETVRATWSTVTQTNKDMEQLKISTAQMKEEMSQQLQNLTQHTSQELETMKAALSTMMAKVADTMADLSPSKCPSALETKMTCYRTKNNFYCLSRVAKTWYDAFQFCRSYNMSLISIQNADKQDELVTVINSNLGGYYSVWTSGRDLQRKRDWIWYSSGDSLTYTNWNHGEPNNFHGDEDCIELRYTNFFPHQWNDENCQNLHMFLCEL